MSLLVWPILVPIVAGLLVLAAPKGMARQLRWVAVVVAIAVFALCIAAYVQQRSGTDRLSWSIPPRAVLVLDSLGGFILLSIGFFSLVMTVYAAGFVKSGNGRESHLYGNMLLSIGAACGIALSGHLVALAVFWGLLGIPLYLLINAGSEGGTAAAKKTMLILGATDSLLLLGVAAFAFSAAGSDGNNTLSLFSDPVPLSGTAAWVGVLCFLAAALAKAGAMPFHTWVPDASETAPVPAVALLPASLDKLLGIYLLIRIFTNLCEVTDSFRVLCMLVGAATVVLAVMSAMVQHNLRRLLGFHAVSQVGYMVIGIASGTAVGMAGGLFHMFNNAAYKGCLFLTAGAAERKTGETELDRMGGLAREIPLVFASALIAALAISGVPPLNGFASKWMVYNGVLASQVSGTVRVVVLLAAMFGSALTLASFVKVLHSVFLGQAKKREQAGEDPGVLVHVPMLILAGLCIILGVWATRLGLRSLILPALAGDEAAFTKSLVGFWLSGRAAVLLLVALLFGFGVYALSSFAKRRREDEAYIGGEIGPDAECYNFEGVEFYKTIAALPVLRGLFRGGEAKWFDLYDQCRKLTFYVSGWLGKLHGGILYSYVTWCVLGLIVILWWLMSAFKILGRSF